MIKRMMSLLMAFVLILNIPFFASAEGECTSGSPYSEVVSSEKEPVRIRKELSEGVKNIVKRSRQMSLISWTPLKNIIGWERFVTYKAGVTYTGLPYGQPIFASYVPWWTSLEGFMDAVNNPKSKLYTDKSTYNEVAPFYSVDCSAYVSWAWQMPSRLTTAGIPENSELISKTSLDNAQVGDALCKRLSHVVLITDMAYDENGRLSYVEISEATAKENTDCCCVITVWGEGCEFSLDDLYKKYFGDGYFLYRNPSRDSVTYTHSCAVVLEGDRCSKCRAGMHTSLGEVCGSVEITEKSVCSYVEPADRAVKVREYKKGSRITVTEKARDGHGGLWYKTESGTWLNSDGLKLYENEFCTEWTEAVPENTDEAYIEERYFYRSAEKETVTSLKTSLKGYTREGSRLVKYNTDTLKGITEWPEGFDKSSDFYKKYDLTYLTAITQSDYRRTVSRPSARGYIYYHYCDGKNASVSDTESGKKTVFHCFSSKISPDELSKAGECCVISSSRCKCSDRFYAIPLVAVKYNEFRREYVYSRIGEWSEWTDKKTVAEENTVVERKLFCRYNDTAHSWIFTKVQNEADCKSRGVAVYTCKDCGKTKKQYTPETAHISDGTVSALKKAGINKSGKGAVYCSVCGEKTEDVKIPAITKTVQSFTSAVYDGKSKTPSIRFYDSEGNRLVYKTDFTVKYPSQRKKPGKYTAKVTFKGKYEGEKLITFTIKPSAVNLSASSDKSSVILSWDDLPEATGYRVYRYNTSTKKYKALKTTLGTAYTDSALEPGKRYYYVVKAYTKVKGETYWSTFSKAAVNTKKK
ncbi:MAG: hypothetical protein IKJ27_05130 [Clostridia bacterium]|nr:hypothetical protein [Clostridia bacterium]